MASTKGAFCRGWAMQAGTDTAPAIACSESCLTMSKAEYLRLSPHSSAGPGGGEGSTLLYCLNKLAAVVSRSPALQTPEAVAGRGRTNRPSHNIALDPLVRTLMWGCYMPRSEVLSTGQGWINDTGCGGTSLAAELSTCVENGWLYE